MRYGVLLWLICCLARGATVELELLPSATTRGKTVLVGDVVRVHGADPAIAAAVGAVRLGAAPLAGYSGQFSRAAVAAALAARPATSGLMPDWRGAERAIVRRAATTVSGDELASVARRRVEMENRGTYERLELIVLGTVADVQVPEGDLALRVREPLPPLRRRTMAWIDVLVDGAVYRSVAVPLQAGAWNTVPVTRRSMAGDSLLREADVRAEQRDVLALPAPAAPLPRNGQAMRLREALAEGQVVQANHVVPPGAIRQGDRVTLVMTDAAIRIETTAVAQQDGVTGALVRVKPANGDAVAARVAADGVVTMEGR